MSQIAKNLKRVNQQILKNATGPPPTLVAVTKTRSVKEINEAISLGIKSIGENRVQEAETKFQKISKKVEKRFVGHLQSNKIKKAINLFDSIDSVGSYVLAQKISIHCQKKGKIQRILIQINTSEEKTKSGFLLSEKKDILKCFSLPSPQIDGLMTIGPLAEALKDFPDHGGGLTRCDLHHRPSVELPGNGVHDGALEVVAAQDVSVAYRISPYGN